MRLRVNGSKPVQSITARKVIVNEEKVTHKQAKAAIATAFKTGSAVIGRSQVSKEGVK